MKHFSHLMSNFKSHLKIGVWIFFAVLLIQLTSCGEKDEPFPAGFEKVAGFELIARDSIVLVGQGNLKLTISPKFTAAFGEEVFLETLPPMQFIVDGNRSANPVIISTEKARVFEIYAIIGKLKSKPIRIRVIDVDPNTYIRKFSVSMGDSTKAPYAIAGKSQIDFKISILDYRSREFAEANKPAYSFYLDGVEVKNHTKVPISRSGEIPFWVEVGGIKSETKILYSRELPDFSKTYSLPMVFHVIHTGELIGHSENPSQQQLSSLLNKTNDILMGRAKSNFRKGHNQVDPNFEFFLATTNLEGNVLAEAGMNRITSTTKSFKYDDPATVEYLFELMWNPEEYVNVFVLNIENAVGFAMYPPQSPPPLTNFYGIAIRKSANTFTMAHEIGHFFGMRHTFSDGFECKDPDGFLDTEAYDVNQKITDRYFKANCEGELFFGTNFMEYSPTVGNTFTLEQVQKARSIIDQGNFLPKSSSLNSRVNPKPWVRGVFNPDLKPVQ